MSKQLKSDLIVCRSCNLTVPDENHIAIQTATKTIYVCVHHEDAWMAKAKAAAELICTHAGSFCDNIAGLSKKVIHGTLSGEIAGFAEQLLDAVRKKADQLKGLAKEKLADFRRALSVLAHLLDYPRTARAFI